MSELDARIGELVHIFIHEWWQARVNASRELIEIGTPAVPALVGLLKNDDEKVRRKAAETLGRMKGKASAAVPALIEALNDTYAQVRYEAVFALGEIGKEALPAVPVLIQKLDDRSKELRTKAAVALEKLVPYSSDIVPVMIRRLRHPDKDARWYAEGILERAGERALASLLKAVVSGWLTHWEATPIIEKIRQSMHEKPFSNGVKKTPEKPVQRVGARLAA